ncbi:MAG: hypothetical protein ACI8W8_004664 [Rhodothermales bacterium]
MSSELSVVRNLAVLRACRGAFFYHREHRGHREKITEKPNMAQAEQSVRKKSWTMEEGWRLRRPQFAKPATDAEKSAEKRQGKTPFRAAERTG